MLYERICTRGIVAQTAFARSRNCRQSSLPIASRIDRNEAATVTVKKLRQIDRIDRGAQIIASAQQKLLDEMAASHAQRTVNRLRQQTHSQGCLKHRVVQGLLDQRHTGLVMLTDKQAVHQVTRQPGQQRH